MMLLLMLCLLPLALSAPKPKHLLIETADDKQPQIPEVNIPERPKGSNDYGEEHFRDDGTYDWEAAMDSTFGNRIV